jgi:hypothetical protein
MKIKIELKKFPKKRPPLPKKIKKIFNKFLLNNRQNFLSELFEKWLHYSIKDRESNKTVLELGAGTLNHFKYENLNKTYDIIEPLKFLFKNSIFKKKINRIYKNIKNCNNSYYSRIISCAVLQYHTDIPELYYQSSLKLKKNGYHQHSVPCEGYLMWDLTRYLTNGLLFKIKYGYSFKYMAKHEHVNSLDEIIFLTKFFYKNFKIKYSYPFFSKFFSFYANIEFSRPNKKNIKKYLELKKNPQKFLSEGLNFSR